MIVALASGLALSTAYAPIDAGPVAFVALAPLLLSVRGASVRDGAVAGAAFGLGFFGVLLAWLSLVGWLAWGGGVLVLTASMTGFGAGAAALSRGGVLGRVVGIPVLYTGIEMFRSRYPLGGFAWGLLGSSQHNGSPVLPLARAGGTFAVSLALVVIAALLAETIAAKRGVMRALALACAAAVAIVPVALPMGAVQQTGTLDVAIVQGNVPRGHFEGLRRGRIGPEDPIIIANHVRLTETLSSRPPELVVWPENALDRDPFTDQSARDGVGAALRATGAPLLVGAILDAEASGDFYNSNLLFSPDGTVVDRYDKIHLVPFGEYVPWGWARRVIPALDQVPTDGVPGKAPVVMTLPSGERIGSVICFENSYPALVRTLARRGAGVLVVSANIATFGRSPLARQHLALSRMRAIETGRPVLHAAISGISAVIEPDGSVVQQSGLSSPAVLRQTIPVAAGQTPYVAYGAMFEAGLGIAAALAALAGVTLAMLRTPSVDLDDDDEAFWHGGSPRTAKPPAGTGDETQHDATPAPAWSEPPA